MQFDTLIYAFFLIIVFAMYWAIPRQHYRLQNCLILAASYLFYGWWDYRFLALIAATTLVTYTLALAAARHRRLSKLYTSLSVTFSLGVLATFKYFGFFVETLQQAAEALGVALSLPTLRLVLPIGISFYTFQAISYAVEVHRRTMQPTTDPVTFACYIAFFPQLVAGPIEKPSQLIPQFAAPRTFCYAQAVIGMRQILWGLAKKVVVANTLASYVDNMLYNPLSQTASTLILGNIFFAIQIYADFSAYSDIAIGSARLLGIHLTVNFRYPYFSHNMAELWRRWHITLMNWFRDYVYIPLGGSRCSLARTCANILVVYALSGLWHGANFTFIIWGLLNGTLVAACHITKARPHGTGNPVQSRMRRATAIASTFFAAAFCFIPFRCYSIANYQMMLQCIAHNQLFCVPNGITALPLVAALFAVEWLGRYHDFALERMPASAWQRFAIYWFLLAAITYCLGFNTIQYIYFQF